MFYLLLRYFISPICDVGINPGFEFSTSGIQYQFATLTFPADGLVIRQVISSWTYGFSSTRKPRMDPGSGFEMGNSNWHLNCPTSSTRSALHLASWWPWPYQYFPLSRLLLSSLDVLIRWSGYWSACNRLTVGVKRGLQNGYVIK